MIAHTCKQGRKKYLPGHGHKLMLGVRGFTLVFSIPKTAWFDPSVNGPLGKDGKDWNKVGGQSFIHPLLPWTWLKNSNAAMVAFRPSEQPGWFEVVAYTNDLKTNHITGPVILIEGNTGGAATVLFNRKSVTYELQGQSTTHDIKRWAISIPIGPWFGGNRRSPITQKIFTDYNTLK